MDTATLIYNYEICTVRFRLWQSSGIFTTGQSIYLHDKEQNTYTDLTKGSYTFNTEAGEFTNRFEIVYEPQQTLGTGDTAVNSPSIIVYKRGESHVVRSFGKPLQKIEVYDGAGRLLMQTKGKNQKEVEIPSGQLNNGVYYLRITTENETISKKITT